MIRTLLTYTFLVSGLMFALASGAEDKIELKTIQIKGNKELPKILYVVPWQDAGHNKKEQQKVKLHNFFGELYEPLTPAPPAMAFDE